MMASGNLNASMMAILLEIEGEVDGASRGDLGSKEDSADTILKGMHSCAFRLTVITIVACLYSVYLNQMVIIGMLLRKVLFSRGNSWGEH